MGRSIAFFCTLHLRLLDGRLAFPVLAGACQFGMAWAGLRLDSFMYSCFYSIAFFLKPGGVALVFGQGVYTGTAHRNVTPALAVRDDISVVIPS